MSTEFYEGLATWSQVVAAIAFIAVLVWIWRRFLGPGIAKSEARKNAERLDSMRRRDLAKSEIDTARAELERAESDATTIVARAETEAVRQRDRILRDAGAESERVEVNANGELERGLAAAREQLRADILAKAVRIARDAASKVDAETDRRLVSDAIEAAEDGGRA